MVEADLVRGLVEERERQLNKQQEKVRPWVVNAKLHQLERAIIKKASKTGLSIETAPYLTLFFVDVKLTSAETDAVCNALKSKGYRVTVEYSIRISWYKPCLR